MKERNERKIHNEKRQNDEVKCIRCDKTDENCLHTDESYQIASLDIFTHVLSLIECFFHMRSEVMRNFRQLACFHTSPNGFSVCVNIGMWLSVCVCDSIFSQFSVRNRSFTLFLFFSFSPLLSIPFSLSLSLSLFFHHCFALPYSIRFLSSLSSSHRVLRVMPGCFICENSICVHVDFSYKSIWEAHRISHLVFYSLAWRFCSGVLVFSQSVLLVPSENWLTRNECERTNERVFQPQHQLFSVCARAFCNGIAERISEQPNERVTNFPPYIHSFLNPDQHQKFLNRLSALLTLFLLLLFYFSSISLFH